MTSQRVGSVLADRYELLDPLDGDDATERYRALDRRLHREVVVEVERDGADRASTADGVRTLAQAEDTGMHAVLDGGEVAGHHFVVREVQRGSFDDTAVLHTGPTTAVFTVPPLELAPSGPTGPGPGRRPSQWTWLVGLVAVAVVVVALAAWAGGGDAPPVVESDSTSTVVVDTTPATTPAEVVVTTPTTEVPTTTVPDVVSDPEETDQFPEGFPFNEEGPPGKEKKDEG